MMFEECSYPPRGGGWIDGNRDGTIALSSSLDRIEEVCVSKDMDT